MMPEIPRFRTIACAPSGPTLQRAGGGATATRGLGGQRDQPDAAERSCDQAQPARSATSAELADTPYDVFDRIVLRQRDVVDNAPVA